MSLSKTKPYTLTPKPLLKIGEAAKILGVSIDTLRRWEASGKIQTIRTPGGTRLYDSNVIANTFDKLSVNSAKQSSPSIHEIAASQTPHNDGSDNWRDYLSSQSQNPIIQNIHLGGGVTRKSTGLPPLRGVNTALLVTVFAIVSLFTFTKVLNLHQDRSSSFEKEPTLTGHLGNVLAESTTRGFLQVNGDTEIKGVITAQKFNGLTITPGDGTLTVTGDVNLNQNLTTTSSPSFTAITATGAVASGSLSVSGASSLTGAVTLGNILHLGSLASEPATASNGQTYYNTTSNKFRCYQNTAWKDCDTDTTGTSFSDLTLAGSAGTSQTIGSGNTITIAAGNGVITTAAATDTLTVDLDVTTTSTSTTTTANSGLEVAASGLSLLRGCSDTQVLSWDSTNVYWECAANGGVFSLAGDSGTSQTIAGGDTLTVTGGTNGIDTVASTTDTITLNLDTTEIGTNTFGSGSGVTWTFDVGATDPTFAFATNSITVGSSVLTVSGSADGTDALVLTAGDILVSNGDLDLSGGDFNVTLDADDGASITNSAATADALTTTLTGVGSDALQLTLTQSDDADATDNSAGLRLALTSSSGDADLLYGIDIGNITEGTAAEVALRIGSGWTNLIELEGATDNDFEAYIQITDPTADRTYTLPNSSGEVCLVAAGNCAGSGTGVTTTGGTTNRLSKFTGSQAIGDSTISDDGTTVTFTVDVDFTFAAGENLSLTNTTASTDQLNLSVSGVTTSGADGIALAFTQADDADASETNAGIDLNITGDSGDADTLIGINIANLAGASAAAISYGIQIGNGWDSNLYLNDTTSRLLLADGATVVIHDGTNTLCTVTDSGTTGDLSCTGNITGGSSGTSGFWSRTSTTLSPATANDIVSIANTNTSGADFAITNTGIYTGTGLLAITANSATSGDILKISATGLTGGQALEIDGSTSTGVTGNFVDIATDVGSAGSLLYLAPDFSGSAVTGYGLNVTATDATANANTDYGIYQSLALTGNAAKVGIGLYSTVTTSSTTADTLVSLDLASSVTGIITTGTRNVYGVRSQPSAGAESTGGTTNVYGLYSALTADVGAGGTINAYGLYVDNGTFDTDGTSTNYGIYINTQSGADTNYALVSAIGAGNFGVGTVAPTAKLDIDTTQTSGDVLNISVPSATTLTGAVNGLNIDLSTNVTATSQDLKGLNISLANANNARGIDIGALTGIASATGINVGAINAGTSPNTGDGADGAVTFASGTENINTETFISGRSCGDGGDAVNYTSTANTVATSTTILLSTTPASGCLVEGDEVLIINLMRTSGTDSDVGEYETKTISSISSATLTFASGLSNGYDGSTQKIMVQRIPNYTTVDVSTEVTVTGTAFNGTKGGVIFFRATGTVTLNGTGIISANGLGYAGGAGGISNQMGSGGQSYDGNGTNTSASNGNGTAGGGSASAGTAGTRGGGGGGGNNGYAGAGGGGGYGGGGGGAGGGGDTGGSGGSGGDTDVDAGGGGGGGGQTGGDTGGNGGNADSAGTDGTGSSPGTGGVAGVAGTDTGQGGGAQTSDGGGGGGGGRYGSSSLSAKIYFGSGGGGGGDGSGIATGGAGGAGGGIVMISANNFSIGANAIRSNGGVAGSNAGNGGNGGGGAGGSILLNSTTSFIINSATTATGGIGQISGVPPGDGGNGGVGRINIGNSSSATTVSDPDYVALSTTAPNIYGIALSTLTGGTTANYQITTGAITSIASATNYQVNLGSVAGAASATFGAINTGALSGAGTTSYGINLGANTSTATTNYGINVGAISGAGTTNYGLYVGEISGATTNYGAYFAGGSTTQAGFSPSIDNEAIDITTVSGIRTVAAIDINEDNTTGAVPTIQWDSAETRGGFLNANLTGALGTEHLIDIDTTAAFTSNLIDITTATSASSGNMIDLNFGAILDTGDAINIAMGATAVGAQALVIANTASIRTASMIQVNDNNSSGAVATFDLNIASTRGGLFDIDTSGAFGTENLIDITTGAQIWTSSILDINVGAAAATGDIFNIALGSSAPAVQALVVTGSSSTATGGVISLAVNTAAAQSADIIDITSTIAAMNGSDTFQAIDINLTGANHTSTLNVITGIDLALTTPDADATETALNIGANWDMGITLADNLLIGLGTSAGRIEFDDTTTDEVNILGANVGIGTSTPGGILDIDTIQTSGDVLNISVPSATTLTGGTNGINVNLSTNVTATSQSLTGLNISLATADSIKGIDIGALTGIASATGINVGAINAGTSPNTGDGADGAVTFSSSTNLNTTAARSCVDGTDTYGSTQGWAPIYRSTATTLANSITIQLSTNPVSTCLAAGDEVLIINLMGTSGDNSNVGKYETKTISSISTDTLTFASGLSNGYDGATQKIMVMRIPNFTTVTVNDTVIVDGLDFDGTAGGVIMFRSSSGAVTLLGTGTIDGNGMGYTGGAGATSGNANAGFTGQSYDGTGTNTHGTDGAGIRGGGSASPGSAGTRGGGGGGGRNVSDGSGQGGGGGGGGYGGGGGGGGASEAGAGGSGGDTGVNAGGGGGAQGSGGNGGNAGNAGGSGVGTGGAAGSGATTGQGGGAGTASGGGGGGGGLYGSSSLTNQIFLGSGGAGGGYSTTPGAGGAGGTGGGIILISANNFTIGSGIIRSNGSVGSNSGATGSGAGGGGAGGSILLNSTTSFAINASTTTTGAAGGTTGGNGGGGGAGGVGRINIGNSSSATTVSNPDYVALSTTAPNIYGIALSTLTGGTTLNYQITTGTLTAISSSTSFQENLGAVVGAASATFGGIQTGALSGAGTTSYGLNLGANTSTATTNYGINVGAISGAGTTNYGLYVGEISGATTNYGAYFAGGSTTQAGFSPSIDNEAIDITTVSGIRTVAAIDINENNTTGTVPTIQWDSAQTRGGFLDANLTGALGTEHFIDIDTSAAWTSNLVDITTGAQIWTGNMFDINVGAAAATGDIFNIALGSTAPAVQALVVTGSSSTATGGVISLAVNTAAAQSSDIIDITSTLGIMNGSDIFQAIDINITGANHTGANTITGIDLALTTPDAEATETALNIGANWDTDINATTALDIGIGGTNEVTLSSTAFSPATTDSNALGTSSLFWSDLFLASGAVINFNSDMTITHAADNLTFAGGTTNFNGAVAYGSQQTFVDADTTPDVSAGSHWITNTTAVEITDFDAGAGTLANGQIIYVESAGAVTYDFTAGNLKLGAADIVTAAGDLTAWIYDGTDWTLVNWVEQADTQSGGADLAEWYVSSEPLEPGDVVSIADTSEVGSGSPEVNAEVDMVESSKSSYDQKVMGIVSTEPGIILGPQEQHTFPIALAGRVPTKVSSENGPIEVGDYLTSSSVPGVAMAACAHKEWASSAEKSYCRPGPTVGKALETFDGSSPQGSNNNSSSTEPEASGEVQFGKVMTFVNVSYADPGNFFASLSLDNDGNLIVPKLKVGQLTLDPNIIPTTSPSALSTGDSSIQPTDISQKLAEMEERIKSLESVIASGSEAILPNVEIATDSASPRNDEEEATSSADLALEPVDILISTQSASLANLNITETLSSEKLLTALDTTVSGIFKSLGDTILGNTTIAGDLTVDGTFSISQNSINALGANTSEVEGSGILFLQNSPLAQGLNIFNGLVTINKEGKLVAEEVQAKQFSITEGGAAGKGTLLKGQTEIIINNTYVKENSTVILTPTTLTSQNLTVTTKVNGGFLVEINTPELNDITFDYLIIGQGKKVGSN